MPDGLDSQEPATIPSYISLFRPVEQEILQFAHSRGSRAKTWLEARGHCTNGLDATDLVAHGWSVLLGDEQGNARDSSLGIPTALAMKEFFFSRIKGRIRNIYQAAVAQGARAELTEPDEDQLAEQFCRFIERNESPATAHQLVTLLSLTRSGMLRRADLARAMNVSVETVDGLWLRLRALWQSFDRPITGEDV